MKSVVLAIAVLTLIALPAAAQYTDQTPTTSTPLTTTEPSAVTAPLQEERTNPVVPTHSPNSGLTATGTVASWNDEEVVLKTAIGLTHFKLMPNTTGMTSGFTEGQSLTIDFNRNEHGVLLAEQVRLADAATIQPQGITTPGATAAGAAVEEAVENVGEAVEEGVEETLQTDVTGDDEIGSRGDTDTTSLPATGSKSPLLALLGLLALGGAATLRRT